MKKIFLLLIITLFFFFSFNKISAHSGRTNSSGCHNCNVGSCAGTYHCHNGGYVPPVYVAPAPVIPENPIKSARWDFIQTETNPYYNILFKWEENVSRYYSITIEKIPGADPGPNYDTTETSYLFKNITPGKWYVNMKASVDNSWSKILYWTIDVPSWIEPTPTPTPTDTPIPTLFIDTPTSNKSFFSSFFEWIFGSRKDKNNVESKTTTAPPYTCNCAKTCTQISTCTEAYYQLNTCGCSVRDGDDDGVPCENLCN